MKLLTQQALTPEAKQKLIDDAVFVPCNSRAALQNWLRVYLNIDLPDCIVDPESNSSPMDLLWDMYSLCRRGGSTKESVVLTYSARMAFKTLVAAIMELLCVIHLDRDVAHMAATEGQAQKCQSYVKEFFKKPWFSKFLTSDNERKVEIVRYRLNGTHKYICEKEYKHLPENEKPRYTYRLLYIKIVIATVKGANSDHVPFFCLGQDTWITYRHKGSDNQTKQRIGRLYENATYDPYWRRGWPKDFELYRCSEYESVLFKDPKFELLTLNQTEHRHEWVAPIGMSKTRKEVIYLNTRQRQVKTSTDHPFWVKGRGFTKAGEIAVGDKLQTISGRHATVTSIARHGDTEDVYDFLLPQNHTFYADGFLTHNCCDELDIANPKPVKEAESIPDANRYDGGLPLTLMISSRKTSFGLVQKKLDIADKAGITVKHWNIIDVTEACPASKHLPALGQIPIYYCRNDFSAISEKDFIALDPKAQQLYERGEGYEGCLKNCRMFAACRGYLATRQKCRSKMLKNVDRIENEIIAKAAEEADYPAAQLLCWKPGSVGAIYPRLDTKIHLKTAAEIALAAFGDTQPPWFSQGELVQLFKNNQVKFYGGMDFGFTHNFAVVIGCVVGRMLYIIDALAVPGLESNEKVEVCDARFKQYGAVYYPDPESPSDIKTFREHGYQMVAFTKDVQDGIDVVRSKIWPGFGLPPEIYFLSDSEGVMGLYNELTQYHWKMDAQDKPTNIPDKTDDDSCDALRYLVHNLFKTIKKAKRPAKPRTHADALAAQNAKALAAAANPVENGAEVNIRKGRFRFMV